MVMVVVVAVSAPMTGSSLMTADCEDGALQVERVQKLSVLLFVVQLHKARTPESLRMLVRAFEKAWALLRALAKSS